VCLGVGLAAGAGVADGLSTGCAGAFGVGLTANFSGGWDDPFAGGGGTGAGCAGAAAAAFGNWLRISWVASSLMELEGS